MSPLRWDVNKEEIYNWNWIEAIWIDIVHIECLEVASKTITKAWITNNLENQVKLTSSMCSFLYSMEWKIHELHNDHLTIEQTNDELFEF
jgi:hypothetical protein